MRRPGQVLSRLQLLEHAWDYAYENRSNVVDVYVRYLREKIDRPFGVRVARDGARRRLPAAGGRRVDDAGCRSALRLTLAFALAMAVVLAAPPARSSTCGSARRPRRARLDQELARARPRISPRSSHAGRLARRRTSLVEARRVVRRAARPPTAASRRDAAARPRRAPDDGGAASSAAAARSFADRATVPGSTSRRGCSRSRVEPDGRRLVLVVGASRENRAETLRPPAARVPDRRPARAAARVARRLRARRRGAAADRGDAPARGGDLDRDARRAPAASAGARRDRAARRDAERDARPARGRARARAPLRRRREPRAADAARAAEDRARAGAAAGRDRRRSSRRAALGRRGDRPAGAARRRPAVLARAEQGRLPLRPEPARVAELLDAVARASPRGPSGGRAVDGRRGRGAVVARPTGSGSSRRSGTWSTTPFATARARSRSSRRGDGLSSCTSPTRARASAASVAHAFERFSRATTASRRGSGLGLAIVEAIARAHGGSAREEPPEGGADVWIPLPSVGSAPWRSRSGLVRRNGRDLPWRTTRDPYAILVSEVMPQQTQVARVVPR